MTTLFISSHKEHSIRWRIFKEGDYNLYMFLDDGKLNVSQFNVNDIGVTPNTLRYILKYE